MSLRSTFVPLERDALRRQVASWPSSGACTRRIAQAFGLPYPAELDRLVGGHLEHLIEAHG